MTIRKKGSRKIIVGQDSYRWIITPSAKVLTLTVHHDGSKGQLLRIIIESDINEFWVEFPKVESLNNKVVKPADVASLITETSRKQVKKLDLDAYAMFIIILLVIIVLMLLSANVYMSRQVKHNKDLVDAIYRLIEITKMNQKK